jgi:hypothetical protein
MALGRRYSIDGQRAVASPTKTLLGLTGGTTVRPFVYDMLFGSSAAPADNAILWYVQRYTAAGTSTAVTPTAIDPADPAASSTSGQNHTVEPTYTAGAILFHLALNQRASHRWIADPNGPLTIPASANNGLGLYPVHASFTGNVDAVIHFAE